MSDTYLSTIMMTRKTTVILLIAGTCLLVSDLAHGQADPRRGLWVGQATLNEVGEVTVPLDEDNIPIAPPPGNPPAPTRDEAHLRLILHVNGAGQVSLLKDVAILDRNAGDATADGTELVNLLENPSALDFTNTDLEFESDVALVTDERIYGEFPPQPAIRIASAVFDFGDSKATDAVNAVLEAVVDTVAGSVDLLSRSELDTLAKRVAAQQAAELLGAAAGDEIIAISDAAAAFEAFLNSSFVSSSAVDDMAANDAGAIADAETAAINLRERGDHDATTGADSFFSDARGVDMIAAIVAIATDSALTSEQKEAAAHNIASTFADIDDNYHGFLAGQTFNEMIEGNDVDLGAAASGAAAAIVDGADEASIRAAVNDDGAVDAAKGDAVRLKDSTYKDTRADNAIAIVLDAIINSLVLALPATADEVDALAADAVEAARDVLAERNPMNPHVERFEVPQLTPTTDYSEFVRSEGGFELQSDIEVGFEGSAALAAEAAAEEAVLDRSTNAFSTLSSVNAAAKTGALNALQTIYAKAARAVATELGLNGTIGAVVNGTIVLPPNHPTNPFRHRRHPDHTTGLDGGIQRDLTLDFDGEPTDPLVRAGFNVDRMTGTYDEEIFGLHKLGLKVRGRFVLNRISLIDNLNAR